MVTGSVLTAIGMALIAITNILNKREHDQIMTYLEAKVEELSKKDQYQQFQYTQEY